MRRTICTSLHALSQKDVSSRPRHPCDRVPVRVSQSASRSLTHCARAAVRVGGWAASTDYFQVAAWGHLQRRTDDLSNESACTCAHDSPNLPMLHCHHQEGKEEAHSMHGNVRQHADRLRAPYPFLFIICGGSPWVTAAKLRPLSRDASPSSSSSSSSSSSLSAFPCSEVEPGSMWTCCSMVPVQFVPCKPIWY